MRVSYSGLLYQPSKLRTRVRFPSPAPELISIIYFNMSKKKKKKTRKQKEKAIINRQKHLSVINKPERSLAKRKVEIAKESPKAIQKVEDNSNLKNNKIISSDIKKSLVFTVFFIVIIFGLYFLQKQMNYIEPVSNHLISFLTK